MQSNPTETVKQRKISLQSDVNAGTFSAYVKFCKDTGNATLKYTEYSSIIATVNKLAMDKVMTGRYTVRFPKLGMLSLIRVKPTKLIKKIDWGRYRKDGVYTTFKNHHTEGFMYRVFFYLYERKMPQFGFYNFKLSKANQVKLGQKLINNEVR
jgi:hypothetical protein